MWWAIIGLGSALAIMVWQYVNLSVEYYRVRGDNIRLRNAYLKAQEDLREAKGSV